MQSLGTLSSPIGVSGETTRPWHHKAVQSSLICVQGDQLSITGIYLTRRLRLCRRRYLLVAALMSYTASGFVPQTWRLRRWGTPGSFIVGISVWPLVWLNASFCGKWFWMCTFIWRFLLRLSDKACGRYGSALASSNLASQRGAFLQAFLAFISLGQHAAAQLSQQTLIKCIGIRPTPSSLHFIPARDRFMLTIKH